ncbi:putative quinone oxidoreductase [Microdochium trichocladiopsis]|uniref:Quinone oxidoreductase n=1 Tax=Microdochium trichocladiopsis TaxID=1682393 RepID=A0A9P8YA30_9PEZI|nr:putative quinone oxidoreductase [Microdochium trichocladiopsis]KAH7031544.1 putative quinone oxidoreductase [Microdochium trichocladiopsis]
MATNQAAWLREAGKPLEVSEAHMPTAGPDEIVIENAAIAINPLDNHMQDIGVFVSEFPAIIGCDVAGIVHEVGAKAGDRFKKGDRVIGHTINLITSKSRDGAYARYTVVKANKAAILPDKIPFKDGVVVPFALEAAVCSLSVKEPGTALPNVPTPALGLPYPVLGTATKSAATSNKTLVVYGGSSSVGSMVTQLATAAGIRVIAIASAKNSALCETAGAEAVIDYHNHPDDVDAFVDEVAAAVNAKPGQELVGIFDAISIPETFARDLAILAKLGGQGHLACSHPPPAEGVPEGVHAGMIFGVNDVATPVWRDYVTPALEAGELKCLPPPTVVGKGLEYLQKALEMCKAGVSATKIVVEL